MNTPEFVALIVALVAHTFVFIGAWIKTQSDITEVKTDIKWLKEYATHRRGRTNGAKSA